MISIHNIPTFTSACNGRNVDDNGDSNKIYLIRGKLGREEGLEILY